MRIVGATFEDRDAALSALEAMRRQLETPPATVDVCPLGTTDYDRGADADAILAGRFEPETVPQVEELVAAHGGRVVVVRDDSPNYDPRDG